MQKPRPKIKKDYFSFDDALRAYIQCRKHKRNTRSAMDFEQNFVPKLLKLTDEINAGHWRPGRYRCFPVFVPRVREIWAAPFRDRIVHHLIYNELRDAFERHYIDQTYSCIRGRGTVKCINDAFRGCWSITNNFQSTAFFIKLDISSFFVSIDKRILWNIVREKLDENCLLADLVRTVIFSDITKNPRIVNRKALSRVPPQKSLFNDSFCNRGLPIGNLTSQFFSNVYMDGLDQYCKHVLKLKYYYRYADDILILIKNSAEANDIVRKIDEWLKQNRKLSLNTKKTVVNSIRHGVKFLGGRMFYHYKIPANKTFFKIRTLSRKMNSDVFNRGTFASLNSYLGLNTVYDIHSFCAEIMDKTRLGLIYDNDGHRVVYL